MMNKDIESVLVSEAQLDEITTALAERIDEDYANTGRPLVMVCILKGSVMFYVDLVKKIKRPVEIDFMKVSSYGSGTKSTHNINIHLDLQRADIDECDIIVVEDIIDSGRTLSHLTNYLTLKGTLNEDRDALLERVHKGMEGYGLRSEYMRAL